MPSDFTVTGADQFLALSKALKASGRTEMRKDLNKGLKVAARKLVPEIRAAARDELPKRGGLANRMAKRPIRAVTRTGSNAGVGLVMPKTQAGYADGKIRHPVFEKDKSSRKGRKRGDASAPRWVEQNVGPGRWYDDTVLENREVVVKELEHVLEGFIEDIVRGAKRRG